LAAERRWQTSEDGRASLSSPWRWAWWWPWPSKEWNRQVRALAADADDVTVVPDWRDLADGAPDFTYEFRVDTCTPTDVASG